MKCYQNIFVHTHIHTLTHLLEIGEIHTNNRKLQVNWSLVVKVLPMNCTLYINNFI